VVRTLAAEKLEAVEDQIDGLVALRDQLRRALARATVDRARRFAAGHSKIVDVVFGPRKRLRSV
jgi:hypothetical protein